MNTACIDPAFTQRRFADALSLQAKPGFTFTVTYIHTRELPITATVTALESNLESKVLL